MLLCFCGNCTGFGCNLLCFIVSSAHKLPYIFVSLRINFLRDLLLQEQLIFIAYDMYCVLAGYAKKAIGSDLGQDVVLRRISKD